MKLFFSVDMKPRGKQRPRFANGHAYTPQETKDYERELATHAKRAGATPLPHPCVIDVTATFKRPKKSDYYCMKRPDVDNILKMMDALNGVAWVDDKQVVSATVSKNYGEKDCIEFEIEYLQ